MAVFELFGELLLVFYTIFSIKVATSSYFRIARPGRVIRRSLVNSWRFLSCCKIWTTCIRDGKIMWIQDTYSPRVWTLFENRAIDTGISPLPFCLPSNKLEWINQFLFWNFFQLLYKNKQTEVGKWHQISGEPVSIVLKILSGF